MIVHSIGGGEPELMVDVLFWDAIEGAWDVGHVREIDGERECVAGHAADAEAPYSIFAMATGWAHLPPKQEVLR
jgi:hypothetical protein